MNRFLKLFLHFLGEKRMEVINIIDNIMQGNKNDDMSECFTDRAIEQLPKRHEEQLRIDINHRISEHMPANELRTVRRPESMVPRTLFLDTHYSLLPQPLNQSCIENITQTEPGKLKLKIVNSKNLTLEQYFNKSKFKCVYNKLEAYRNDNKTFIGRLKGIDSLIDYNWKNFKELQPQSTNQSQRKHQVDRIDSNFENGNLCKAYRNYQQQNQYYLLIENDVNTYGYNNWFFYRFHNCHKAATKRFTIVNFIKKTSFFGNGMLISIFSKKKWQRERQSWFKGGSKITFSSINFVRNHHENDYYSCLSFEYEFEYEDDEVYFALNQPYTYSRLIDFISTLKEQHVPHQSTHLQIKNIGYTISNNIIPMIRINRSSKSNQIILILARQHPCETTGSFIAQHFIRNLLSQINQISQYLLYSFQFIIIPMVNPDGVIHGMSRCNISGLDLNRHWGEQTTKQLTPQTFRIKQMILNVLKTKKIKYMIDLHGHGKKLNSFFFSCKTNQVENYKLFSLSMKKIQSRFSLCQCTYGIARDKENTIRSKINSMGIGHSYTLQTSLYGWKNQQSQIKHFNEEDYNQISKSLIKSIFLIESPSSLATSLLGMTRQTLVSQMGSMMELIDKDDKITLDNNQILSDSDPEGDRLDVKDIIGKFQDKNIQKKLQQFQKNKLKKQKYSKNLAKNSTGRFSSKNMRQTNPSSFQSTATKTSFHQSFVRKEVVQQSEGKQKGQIKSNKKTSLNEKWEQRRNKILQKQKIENSVKNEMVLDGININKFTAAKPRQKTDTVDKKINHPINIYHSKTAYPKKKMVTHKIKTEFRQIEDIHLSQEEIKQSDARKSALELRFKQLKQQSLNVILTDTLSILKIAPEKLKQRPQPPRQQPSIKSKTVSKRQYISTEPSIKYCFRQTKQESVALQQTLRFKKFKQFLTNSTSPNKKAQKTSNSVFYYFPIL